MVFGHWSTEWRLAGAQQASFALRVQHSQEGQGSEGNPNDIKELLGTTTFQLRNPLALGYQNRLGTQTKMELCNGTILYHPLGRVHCQFSLEDTIENLATASKFGSALGCCNQFLRVLCCSITVCSIKCLWLFSASRIRMFIRVTQCKVLSHPFVLQYSSFVDKTS